MKLPIACLEQISRYLSALRLHLCSDAFISHAQVVIWNSALGDLHSWLVGVHVP